jgi:hypothetical protein
MKILFQFTFLTTLICSCSPKIGSSIHSKQLPLPENEVVLVLQKEDAFTNDGIEIGSIKSGDNGFSTNCSYYEIIEQLKQLARQNGANVIKITEHKSPDQWSTCERLTAKIYKVPDFRTHEKEIQWRANRKLVWEDFKGTQKSISNLDVAAQTYCGFGFPTNRVTMFKKAKIFTLNTFTTNLNWVRADQKYRTDLLVHEQGHFDLSEVYARQLRKRLDEKKLTVFNLSNDANVIFKDVYASYVDRQELYEKETQNGLDLKKQTEWTNQITSELRSLNAFTE